MGKNLEVVDCFKYLGLNFNFSGNFLSGRKKYAIKVLEPCICLNAKVQHQCDIETVLLLVTIALG